MKESGPQGMRNRMRLLDLQGDFNPPGSEGGTLGPSPHVNSDDAITSPGHFPPGTLPPLRSYLREPAVRFVRGGALEVNKEAKELSGRLQKNARPDDECFVSSDEDESGGVLLPSYSPVRFCIDRPAPHPGSDLEHGLVSGLASLKLGSTSNRTTGGAEKSGEDTEGSDSSGNLANDAVSHEHVPVFATNKNVSVCSRNAGDYTSGKTALIAHYRAAKPTTRVEYFQGVGSLKLSKEFSSNVQEKYAPRSAFGRGYAEFNGLPEDFSLSVDSPSRSRSPWNPQTPYRRARTYRGGEIIVDTGTSMLSETSMGFRAMEKLGFEKGKGLGPNSDGIAEPIPITIKVGRGGLGYSPGSPVQPDLVGNESVGARVSDEAAFQSRTNTALVPYNHDEESLVNPETLYSVDSYLARNLTRGKLTLLLRNYCDHDRFLSENRVREVFRACMQHMDKEPGRKFSATQVEAIFRHKFRKAINTLGSADDDGWSPDRANDSWDEDLGLE